MADGLLIAITGGLGGMIGWGLADFFAKKTIDKTSDLTTLFWSQLIGIAPLLILFALHPEVPHLNPYDPLFLVLFGAVSGLSYLPAYTGFGKGQISILSPVFASYALLVALLSALFLGEAVPDLRWVGIAVTFAGILTISADPRDIKRVIRRKGHSVKGLPEVFTAMIAYSVWLVFLKQFLTNKPWVFYLLCIRTFSALTLYVYAQLRGRSLSFGDKRLWKYMALIGVFDVMAFSFISYAFSASSFTSVTAVLGATFSLPTMLLARLYLGERVSRLHAFAAVLILIGIAIISIE